MLLEGNRINHRKVGSRWMGTDMIDSSLSPENLTCDGELPRAEVNRRYKELMTAAKQLKKLDPAVTFYEYEMEI